MKSFLLMFGVSLIMGMMLTAMAAPGAQAAHRKMKRLLVVTVTKGFRHDSIPTAEEVIQALGEKTGDWTTDFVRTDEEMQQKMTPEALKSYDAVCFANTTGVLPLPDPQGFLDYIKDGHGFIAMHAGSDTFHTWPGQTEGVSEYVQMLGGEFLTHHAQSMADIHIIDPHFPGIPELIHDGLKAGGGPNTPIEQLQGGHSVVYDHTWDVFDEIYLLKNNDPANLHVILALNHYPNDGSPDAGKTGEHLIAWSKSYGKGRVFYTVLGHRQEVWRDPLYQDVILGGIRFALGLAHASTKPNMPHDTSASY